MHASDTSKLAIMRLLDSTTKNGKNWHECIEEKKNNATQND